jgi:hypothetical protein
VTIERDSFQWVVDIGTVVSGFASVFALILAAKALRDSRDTAEHLAESRRLADAAQLRADREQAARVLSVAEELDQEMLKQWQEILVSQEEPRVRGKPTGSNDSTPRIGRERRNCTQGRAASI